MKLTVASVATWLQIIVKNWFFFVKLLWTFPHLAEREQLLPGDLQRHRRPQSAAEGGIRQHAARRARPRRAERDDEAVAELAAQYMVRTYRVTIQLVPNLSLTWLWRLHFSIRLHFYLSTYDFIHHPCSQFISFQNSAPYIHFSVKYLITATETPHVYQRVKWIKWKWMPSLTHSGSQQPQTMRWGWCLQCYFLHEWD